MQLTYDQAAYVNEGTLEYVNQGTLEDDGTLRIPLADVVTASVISLSLWAAIGWTLWAVIS